MIDTVSVQTAVKTTKKVHHVRSVKIGLGEKLDALVLAAGALYTATVVWFWRHVRRHGVWLSQYGMQERLNNGQPSILHSQSAQKAVECFFAALKTWRTERKTNPTIRAPYKLKRFYKVVWKKRLPSSTTSPQPAMSQQDFPETQEHLGMVLSLQITSVME